MKEEQRTIMLDKKDIEVLCQIADAQYPYWSQTVEDQILRDICSQIKYIEDRSRKFREGFR
jgi:hypothetical protein